MQVENCDQKSQCLKVSRVEMWLASINNLMLAFFNWMVHRNAVAHLRLLEGAEYFVPTAYNPIFEEQLEDLLSRLPDSEAKRQAMELRGFDFGSFISRSLRRAGFQNDDEQEIFHQIIVKLLVDPGRLFKGWEPERHGALIARFRSSVKHAIINASEKNQNRRKFLVATDPTMMAGMYAGRQAPRSNLIEQFRELVGQRLGDLALAILDQKLQGQDTKELVGKSEGGSPSIYAIKREVKEIKKLAEEFAVRHGDPSFLNMLNRAMGRQAMTVGRRKHAVAARQAAKSA